MSHKFLAAGFIKGKGTNIKKVEKNNQRCFKWAPLCLILLGELTEIVGIFGKPKACSIYLNRERVLLRYQSLKFFNHVTAPTGTFDSSLDN